MHALNNKNPVLEIYLGINRIMIPLCVTSFDLSWDRSDQILVERMSWVIISEWKVESEDKWKLGCPFEAITKFMEGGNTEIRKNLSHFILTKLFVPNFIRNWLVVDAIFVKTALWWKISEQHSLRGTDIGEYCIWNQLLYLGVFLGSIGKGHRTLLGCTGRNL